jgi:hypothetical protein
MQKKLEAGSAMMVHRNSSEEKQLPSRSSVAIDIEIISDLNKINVTTSNCFKLSTIS